MHPATSSAWLLSSVSRSAQHTFLSRVVSHRSSLPWEAIYA